MLDIVFASDNGYAPYTAVTLASILKNMEGSEPLRVFVLLDHLLDAENSRKFAQLQTIRQFEFQQIVVNASAFEGIRTSAGISIATYYRLLMHRLLPADSHKVIYLDSDLIIRRSLHELADAADPTALFSGVQDSISKTYNKRYGLPEMASHVNAGVLVVNLDIMRSIPFDSLIANYIEANKYRITLGDQQIITEMFHDRIAYVPLKWNVHGSMFKPGWAAQNAQVQNTFSRDEIESAVRDPAIIHYTLARKPWMSLEHPKAKEWFSYLKLTAFKSDIALPSDAAPVAKISATPLKKQAVKLEVEKTDEPAPSLKRFLKVVLPATWTSFKKIRKTRVKVDQLVKDIKTLRSSIPATISANVEIDPLEKSVRLKQLLVDIAKTKSDKPFYAADQLRHLPSNAVIRSNVHKPDIDGGYAENIKTAFRTSSFGYTPELKPKAVALLSQRIDQGMYWNCLQEAYLNDLPLFFIEVALFGGYASYFDKDANLNERRALGFMVDDMGYYFDCRQPSRFEYSLSSPDYALSSAERNRAQSLIKTIVGNKLTKYNKYVASEPHSFALDRNCVLVVDQKRGDASIEFSNANDESFNLMMVAAVADNPGKTVYFKRHPDSVQRNMNSYRNRNIKEITVLPDDMPIDQVMDRCETIYTVSSQVGFEGLLRGKKVVCFGAPFYAGWGLTDDRQHVPRRGVTRTIEDLFTQACINQSVYIDASTGRLIEMEEALKEILVLRKHAAPSIVA